MSTQVDWANVMATLADQGYLPKKTQTDIGPVTAFVPHAYDNHTVIGGGQLLLASLDMAVRISDTDQLKVCFDELKGRVMRELGSDTPNSYSMRHIATMATDIWAIRQILEAASLSHHA